MNVRYVGGAWTPGEYPDAKLPEVALIGRSNVGKSSIVNTLLRQRQLARVSSTPGRTQAVHFFAVEGEVCLVDLPGFGFAKAPKAVREGFGPLIRGYLDGREALRAVLLLVDIRREPGEEERELARLVLSQGVRLLLVVTKIDKVARTRRPARYDALGAALGVVKGDVVGFSTIEGIGRDELWRRVLREASRGGGRGK